MSRLHEIYCIAVELSDLSLSRERRAALKATLSYLKDKWNITPDRRGNWTEERRMTNEERTEERRKSRIFMLIQDERPSRKIPRILEPVRSLEEAAKRINLTPSTLAVYLSKNNGEYTVKALLKRSGGVVKRARNYAETTPITNITVKKLAPEESIQVLEVIKSGTEFGKIEIEKVLKGNAKRIDDRRKEYGGFEEDY